MVFLTLHNAADKVMTKGPTNYTLEFSLVFE